jgi:hypothetical protein
VWTLEVCFRGFSLIIEQVHEETRLEKIASLEYLKKQKFNAEFHQFITNPTFEFMDWAAATVKVKKVIEHKAEIEEGEIAEEEPEIEIKKVEMKDLRLTLREALQGSQISEFPTLEIVI